MGQNATDHEVGIVREDRMGPTDARTPPDIMLLDTTVDDERVSGPDPRPRAGPAPGDRRIRLVVQGPAVFPRQRMPGLQPLPLMRIIIASLWVIAGPCLHLHRGRRPTASLHPVIIMREDERVLKGLVHHTSPDGKYSCPRPLPSHQRGEPYSTVIPSLARPDHVEEPAAEVDGPATVTGPSEVVDGPADDGPASDGRAGDDPASEGPADDGPAYDGSAGDGSARHDEPVVVDGPEEVADPAGQQSATDGPALQFDDPAGVAGPARLQPLAFDGPAAHGTPAGNRPSAGQDSSILTGVSSPLFPSMPTAINQATLIDFMSMWTFAAATDGPGYGCFRCPGQAGCTVNCSCSQR